MNRKELKTKLDEIGIPTSWYSLYGERILDTLVLEWGFKWRIFVFGERGQETEIASFDTEDEACEYFYQEMKKGKEREERIKNMPPYIPPPPEEKRTFIASGTGEITF